MNQKKIVDMKPGRDMDITVALEIMGYIWLKHLLQFSAELAVKWLGTPADLKESCGMYIPVPDSQFVALKERENYAEAVPEFSTDGSVASQVIVHMEELGYEYYLETKTEENTILHYVCFQKPDRLGEQPCIGFVTLPEAIAKGALTAILCNNC